MVFNKIKICLVIAGLFSILSPINNSFADIFDFRLNFPDVQKQNGLEIATVNPFGTNTLKHLIHVSPVGTYAFTIDGTAGKAPLVQGSTKPYILFQPSGNDQAVMVYYPSEPVTVDLTGEFKSVNGGQVLVNFGVTTQGSVWEQYLNSGTTAPFYITGLKISPDKPLFFAVDGMGASDTATLLKATMYLATTKPEVSNQVYTLCIGLKYDGPIAGVNCEGLFRADLGAQLIADKLTKITNPNNPNNPNNIEVLSGYITDGGISKPAIRRKIESFRNRMKTGDTFILYIGGHGGILNNSPGERYVVIGPSTEGSPYPYGALADNELTDYLQGMDEINKWVIIDACRSGGFWGDNDPTETGDLEKLKKICFLSACGKDEETQFEKFGFGHFTSGLAQALSLNEKGKLNADRNQDGTLTFAELYSYMYTQWPISEHGRNFIGKILYTADFGDPVVFDFGMWNIKGGSNNNNGIKSSKNMTPIISLLLFD